MAFQPLKGVLDGVSRQALTGTFLPGLKEPPCPKPSPIEGSANSPSPHRPPTAQPCHPRPPASLWAAVESIAPKIGCVPQTLLEWVKRVGVDAGVREGVTTSEAQRVKDLEREVKELRRANEILKLASAFFAQAELDRRLKS
jgi:transposase